MEHIDGLWQRLEVVPVTTTYSMLNDIIDHIVDFKYDSVAWWIGLLANYVIRPNKELKKFISQSIKKFKFQSPIVGLHIRRTDKLIYEAKAHSIQSYMDHVHRFYNNLAKYKKIDQKRVYVCTDEPKLIKQLVLKYPEYKFIHPPLNEFTADYVKSRYSAKNLKFFIRDVNLLALSDYLVVTMSSNVGRLAYELHELYHVDSQSRHYASVDVQYLVYRRNQNENGTCILRGVKRCSAPNSTYIDIRVGDILDHDLKISSTRYNYYGFSRRLKKSGYFRRNCVEYVINKWNYRDYSKMDSTIAIKDGKNMARKTENWGQFYCSKKEMLGVNIK